MLHKNIFDINALYSSQLKIISIDKNERTLSFFSFLQCLYPQYKSSDIISPPRILRPQGTSTYFEASSSLRACDPGDVTAESIEGGSSLSWSNSCQFVQTCNWLIAFSLFLCALSLTSQTHNTVAATIVVVDFLSVRLAPELCSCQAHFPNGRPSLSTIPRSAHPRQPHNCPRCPTSRPSRSAPAVVPPHIFALLQGVKYFTR